MKHQIGISIACLLLTGCFAWERDVEHGDYHFERYRVDSDIHIGVLAEPAEVDGFVCAAGEWAHFSPDWSLRACVLAAPYRMQDFTLPAGAWVQPRTDRIVVAFETDTPCQGYICQGSGGTKGIQSTFYPNGRLRAFFPPEAVQVDGVLCRASLYANVQLYESGKLRQCTPALGGEIAGQSYLPGRPLQLDEEGRLVSDEPHS